MNLYNFGVVVFNSPYIFCYYSNNITDFGDEGNRCQKVELPQTQGVLSLNWQKKILSIIEVTADLRTI